MEISIDTAQDNLADATTHLRSFDRWVECDIGSEHPPRSQAHEEALDQREAALADLCVARLPQDEAARDQWYADQRYWFLDYDNRMSHWRTMERMTRQRR